jgi:hypothetical protein
MLLVHEDAQAKRWKGRQTQLGLGSKSFTKGTLDGSKKLYLLVGRGVDVWAVFFKRYGTRVETGNAVERFAVRASED